MERGTRDLPGLVQEYVLPQDGGTLPESIRTKGFATLDALEQSVLSAFPGGGDTPLEGEELEAIFERLGLIAFKQEVTSGVASRFPTFGQFVSGVAECVKCQRRLNAMCTPLQLLKSKIRRDFLRLLEIGLDKGPGPSLVPRRLGGPSRSLTGRLAQILRRGGTPGVENPNPQRLAVY